jgi:DNA repair protein RadC
MATDASPRPNTLSAHDRLDAAGPSALSDQELLTVLLGPTKGSNNLQKAAAALLEAAPLAEMAWASPHQLEQVPGIGPTRAAALAAAFELGRRTSWSPPRRGDRCLDPSAVYELLKREAHAETESFYAIALDVRGRIIKTIHVATGSLTQCPVDPRTLLKEAVRCNAHSLVLAHNHPSGDPTPSECDVELTDRLRAASELVGITVRDHVILATGGNRFSFVEAGRWHR